MNILKPASMFREKAMAKISSPEELDQLMQIIKPLNWLSLIALGVCIFCALVWGILGIITTKVNGPGIIISEGGIIDIATMGGGQVEAVFPRVGDHVTKGMVVALISQPKLSQDYENTNNYLMEMYQQREKNLTYLENYEKSNLLAFKTNQEGGEKSVVVLQERIDFLTKKIETVQKLLQRGLVTEQKLFQLQQDLKMAEQDLLTSKNQLVELQSKKQTMEADVTQRKLQSESELNNVQRNLMQIENQLMLNSRVISEYSGKVIEITAIKGNIVNPGSSILRLQMENEEPKVVLFVDPTEGKKVKPGMKAHISLQIYPPEEFGYMIGVVSDVSEFPATPENMMNLLQNRNLVQLFSQKGPPIKVTTQLLQDSTTYSGYTWTSSHGPASLITAGTVCGCGVIVREQAPISLIFPYIEKELGI